MRRGTMLIVGLPTASTAMPQTCGCAAAALKNAEECTRWARSWGPDATPAAGAYHRRAVASRTRRQPSRRLPCGVLRQPPRGSFTGTALRPDAATHGAAPLPRLAPG